MNPFTAVLFAALLSPIPVSGTRSGPEAIRPAGTPAPGDAASAQTAAPVRTVETGYSFTRAPFVNPRILHEMGAWLSDTGDLVVAINLEDANDSNRFNTWGDQVEVRDFAGKCPFVWWRAAPDADGYSRDSFGYRYVGRTDFGVHLLETAASGGGSGTFVDLLFVAVERGYGIKHDAEREDGGVVRADRERIVLRKLGTIGLGDRWDGELRVLGNDLFIGRDEGWFENHPDYVERQVERTLTIDLRPPAPLVFAADTEPCAAGG